MRLPVAVILKPRAHHDLADLPDDLASEMGLLMVAITAAVEEPAECRPLPRGPLRRRQRPPAPVLLRPPRPDAAAARLDRSSTGRRTSPTSPRTYAVPTPRTSAGAWSRGSAATARHGRRDRVDVTIRAATEADVDFLTDVVIEATLDQGRLPDDFDEVDFRAGFGAWTAEQVSGDGPGSSIPVVGGRRRGRRPAARRTPWRARRDRRPPAAAGAPVARGRAHCRGRGRWSGARRRTARGARRGEGQPAGAGLLGAVRVRLRR